MSELDPNREALRNLSVDQEALDIVRARVMAELRSRRRSLWAWPVVAAACLAILAAWITLPKFSTPAPPQPVEFAKAPKLVKWTVKPVHRAARPPRKRPAEVASAEPLVVKMLTNDPDVIVIWLFNQSGGSE
jgi:hypothetical protein